jgi:polysaccharide biosynthesis transport protein
VRQRSSLRLRACLNMKPEKLPAITEDSDHLSAMQVESMNMSDSASEAPRSGLGTYDILFILFKHKWKILMCASGGLLAAAGLYFLLPPMYESQAKLLVRYVVDKSAVDGLDSSSKTMGSPTEGAINSEVEILTSTDLTMQVADAVGVERLAKESGVKATTADVAESIFKGLKVAPVKETNIISVAYQNEDPKLAMQVLQELVTRYFDKHLEVHRSIGAFDFVTRQTEQLRAQLNQTDAELKRLKDTAGITSLAESTTSLAAELANTEGELNTSEAEIASQQARLKEIEKSLLGDETKESNKTSPQQISAEVVRDYQTLVAREAQLHQIQTELLAKFTSENRIVKIKQAQIDALVNQRRDLEKKHPGLLATVSSATSSDGNRLDIVSERARLAEFESKRDTLTARLSSLQQRGKLLSEYGPRIGQLERTKEVQDANYKYLEASLEKARIDETLDPTRMPNISVVQRPEMGVKVTRDALKKIVIGLAAGGLALGTAIALLIELVLDRTVKRPLELETQLSIPLLLSIPNFAGAGHRRLRLHDASNGSKGDFSDDPDRDIDPLDETGALLRPFCDAIRDRLGLFFELNRMTHKPKLVAVTGLSKNAGASTLATGLAASLSETSEGKVLLVDKPLGPKRFYDMLQECKESDFNYVVFDMPSLGNTSATLPLAGFMDKVLLVVEAEKSNRDAVKRAYTQLAAKADVSVIFNKSRSYGPKWLEGDI